MIDPIRSVDYACVQTCGDPRQQGLTYHKHTICFEHGGAINARHFDSAAVHHCSFADEWLSPAAADCKVIEVPWHLPTATQSYGSMQVMCTDQLLFTFNKSQGWHDLYQAATGECNCCTERCSKAPGP
jgi:hypothetical protein